MVNIEELQARVDQLQSELNVATMELEDAQIAAHPIKVGNRLTSNKGTEVEVTKVDPRWQRMVLFGRKVLKSGKLHKDQHQLYSWEGWKPKEEEPANG